MPGSRYLQLEFLADFFVAPGDPLRAESDERRRLLFEAAAALDAHHIKVGNIPGTPCELGRADRGVRRVVRGRGASHAGDGRLRVHAVRRQRQHARRGPPGGARVPRSRTAASRSTRGTWPSWESRPTSCGGYRLSTSAGSSSPTARFRTWTTSSTRPSTTGASRERASSTSRATSTVCQDIGYGGPWGVEVLSEELRSLPIDQEFDRAYETTIAQFHAGVA